MLSKGAKAFIAIIVTTSALLVFSLYSPKAVPALRRPHRFLHASFNATTTSTSLFGSTSLPSIVASTPITIQYFSGSYQPVYLINEPNICYMGSNSTSYNTSWPPFALIYIHTKPSHFHRRAFLRHTWADPYFKTRFNFSTVFILGDPKNTTVQSQLLNESRTFHDITQGDFHDTYENLTLKEITGLYWTSRHCNQATFVVKADDDLIIKPWFLFDLLRKYSNASAKPGIICRKWEKERPHREKKSKWYVPLSVYPDKYYPAFCSGPSRIVTQSAVPLLFNGTRELPFFWLEDVFVTGIVAEHMGVIRHDEPMFLEDFVSRLNALGSRNFKIAVTHSYGLSSQRRIWKAVIEKFPEYFTGRNLTSFDDGLLDDGE